MRYLFGFICLLALGVVPLVGCSETAGTGGSGGSAGSGGTGGAMPECESPEDCDDGEECTTNACTERACEYTPVADGTPCDVGAGACQDGSCLPCWRCGAGICCPCTRPLDEYCKGSDCPSWEEAIASAKETAVQRGCDCGMWPAAFGAGRCGEFRYVRIDCHVESIKYFDDSGMLVAVYLWTDGCGLVCPGSCSVDYGFRLECDLEPEQDFCDQLPDLVCRDWCTNEPQGSSCYQGPPESVQDCYEDCLESYSKEEEQSGCGIAWIRIKSCALRFECEVASPSSCDWREDQLARCQANSYCEANCPTQDRWECIEQYLAEGVCDVGAFEVQP